MGDFDELKEKTSDFCKGDDSSNESMKKAKCKKLRKTGKCIDFGANDARISGNRKRLLFVAKNRKLLERRRNK